MDGAAAFAEKADVAFASQKPGIMHACGHDAHSTVGLGTAMVLAELSQVAQQPFPGTTRFFVSAR